MSNQQFRVEFSGNLQKLNKALKDGQKEIAYFEEKVEQTEAELRNLTSQSARTAIAIQKLNAALKSGKIDTDRYARSMELFKLRQDQVARGSTAASKNLRGYKNSLDILNGGYQNAGKSINKALPVVQEFGRVIQDAPYGIIGVGNNITQLGDAFGVLTRKVGGGRAALALAARAIFSPAGILVAISAIVSILTVFSRRSSEAKDEIDEFKKSVEKVNDAMQVQVDLASSQERLAKSENKWTIDALEAKKEAYRVGLKGLLTQQQELAILIRKNQKELQTVSNWERIGALGKFFLDQVIIELDRRFGSIVRYAGQVVTFFAAATQVNFNAITDPFVKGLEASNEEIEKQNKLSAEYDAIMTDINNTLAAMNETQKEITKQIEKQTGLASLALLLRDLFDPSKQSQNLQNIVSNFRGFANLLTQQGQNLSDSLISNFSEIPKAAAKGLQDGVMTIYDLLKEITEVGILLENASVNIQNIFIEGFAPALSQVGETIGRELQRGASFVEAAGAGFISAISGLISKVADELITLGVAALAIGKVQAVLENMTSGASKIAVALAAIAVGTGLKAISSAAAGFAGGSTSTGLSGASGFTPNQTFSGSISGGSSGGFTGGGEVVFRISGTSLIGVIDRTLKGKNKTTSDIIG